MSYCVDILSDFVLAQISEFNTAIYKVTQTPLLR